MAQTYRIIFVDDESYSIIKNVPEWIAKDRASTLRFLRKNNFLPSRNPASDIEPQWIVFPEPVYEEGIESFYVPNRDDSTGEIPYVAREF